MALIISLTLSWDKNWRSEKKKKKKNCDHQQAELGFLICSSDRALTTRQRRLPKTSWALSRKNLS